VASSPDCSSGNSSFPPFWLGRTGWPATNADQTVAPAGNSTSRNCRPLLRKSSDISVMVWPSSATTVVKRALSTSACNTSASSKRRASTTSE
jgi:hypothetical protein